MLSNALPPFVPASPDPQPSAAFPVGGETMAFVLPDPPAVQAPNPSAPGGPPAPSPPASDPVLAALALLASSGATPTAVPGGADDHPPAERPLRRTAEASDETLPPAEAAVTPVQMPSAEPMAAAVTAASPSQPRVEAGRQVRVEAAPSLPASGAPPVEAAENTAFAPAGQVLDRLTGSPTAWGAHADGATPSTWGPASDMPPARGNPSAGPNSLTISAQAPGAIADGGPHRTPASEFGVQLVAPTGSPAAASNALMAQPLAAGGAAPAEEPSADPPGAPAAAPERAAAPEAMPRQAEAGRRDEEPGADQPRTAAPVAFRARGDGEPAEPGLRPAEPIEMRPAAGPHRPPALAAGDRPAPAGQPTPLAAVPIEIGAKLLAGVNRFEIRLDPPELGRVDVRLEIEADGGVKARLVVERVDTLNLLQRDARTLERAFEQAGLKPSEGGIDLSLRDQPGQQNQAQNRQEAPSGRSPAGAAPPREAEPEPAERPLRVTWRGGVDLHI
jgi:flagellar hook-length control protein FliK